MATIDILETFQVKAPAATVWQFLIDPNQVAGCLPGAQLDELIDERTFNGSMKVKVGPITTSYKGRVVMTDVDEAARVVKMSADGREGSGGSVRGGMTSRLVELEGGLTEVTVESNAEITGRIAQFGRGLIQEVSHQMFLQFVSCATEKLEAQAAADATASASPAAPEPPAPANDAPGPGSVDKAAEAVVEEPPAATVEPTSAPTASAATPSPATPPAAAPSAARTIEPPPAKPVSVLPVVLKSMWAIVVRTVTSPFRRKR